MAKRRASRKKSSGVSLELVAKWVFLVGLLLSILIGIVPGLPSWLYIVFILMGLLTGFLYVRKENEVHFFLLAIALFTFNAQLNGLPYAGQYVGGTLNAVSFYLGLAAISVAVRNIVGWYVPE